MSFPGLRLTIDFLRNPNGFLTEYRRRRAIRREFGRISVPPIADSTGPIALFCPEAALEPHLSALCILGKMLQDQGHRVVTVRCLELFSNCTLINMNGAAAMTAAQRRQLCLSCANTALRMPREYGLESINLNEFATPELRKLFRKAISDLPEDLRDFQWDGIAFGNLSLFDFTLYHKISDLDHLSPELRDQLRGIITTTLWSYLLMRAAGQKYRFSRVIVFNDYSILLAARLAAKSLGIDGITVANPGHNNMDRTRLVLCLSDRRTLFFATAEEWPKWRNLSLLPDRIAEIADDLITRMHVGGSHVLSPAKTFSNRDILGSLGLSPNRKTLVAFTFPLDAGENQVRIDFPPDPVRAFLFRLTLSFLLAAALVPIAFRISGWYPPAIGFKPAAVFTASPRRVSTVGPPPLPDR